MRIPLSVLGMLERELERENAVELAA
jgi:hypothetical protein